MKLERWVSHKENRICSLVLVPIFQQRLLRLQANQGSNGPVIRRSAAPEVKDGSIHNCVGYSPVLSISQSKASIAW